MSFRCKLPLQSKLSQCCTATYCWRRNSHQWDEVRSPLANLSHVLGVEFPKADITEEVIHLVLYNGSTFLISKQETFQQECGVCYTFDLDDSVPDLVVSSSSRYLLKSVVGV